MFAVMVALPGEVNLRTVCENAQALINGSDHTLFFAMNVFAPGSLGVPVADMTTHVIGSVSFKINTSDGAKYSVLLFRNGKMKISGGSSAFYIKTADMTYDEWMLADVVTPMTEFIRGLISPFDDVEDVMDGCTWRVTLINGSMKIDPTIVNKDVYRDVCDSVSRIVARSGNTRGIISTISPFDHRFIKSIRGRVSSIVLRCVTHVDNEPSPVSARFDHGGHVHFFAFKSMNGMTEIWRELSNILDGINTGRSDNLPPQLDPVPEDDISKTRWRPTSQTIAVSSADA
jgi:hypothetical protein